MKEVLINVPFRDVYTEEVYTAGKTYPMTEERVKEIKEVNPNFVTVVGNAKEAKSGSKGKSSEEKKSSSKGKSSGEKKSNAKVVDGDEDVDGDDVEGAGDDITGE